MIACPILVLHGDTLLFHEVLYGVFPLSNTPLAPKIFNVGNEEGDRLEDDLDLRSKI